VCLSAMASSPQQNLSFQIKILSSESHQFQAPSTLAIGCNLFARDYDAYCHNSTPVTYVENTMVVEAPDSKSLHIACTVYNQWSHCAALPIGQTFQAMKVKNGLEVDYRDRHQKLRKQLYGIVSEGQPTR
jgi:hypothetical protein